MGKTRSAIKLEIKSILLSSGGYGVTFQDLHKILKDRANEKKIKSVLKKLVKKGLIVNEKRGGSHVYRLPSSEEGLENENIQQPQELTFSEMMRRKKMGEETGDEETEHNNGAKESDCKVDIDDEIKRLEAELAGGDSSESESDIETNYEESPAVDDERPSKKVRFEFNSKTNPKLSILESKRKNKDAVLSISGCSTEKITPLPKSMLPTGKSKKMKIDGGDSERKRRHKIKDSAVSKPHESDGLRQAVQEVLSGYKARSSERIPFYCRVCSHQSKNEEEFINHKKSEFHKAAVQMEKKATYCKLCRKQLTSIVQMREHLQSKPHKERMDLVKQRQRGGRFQSGKRGKQFLSEGRNDQLRSEGGRRRSQNDERQWC
jgi:uncharacterized membrane protein